METRQQAEWHVRDQIIELIKELKAKVNTKKGKITWRIKAIEGRQQAIEMTASYVQFSRIVKSQRLTLPYFKHCTRDAVAAAVAEI